MIDGVIAAGIATWFSEAGFTRKGRSFFRRHGDLVQTSAVQASKINMPDAARFAVNLGVEWPYWYEVWTGRELKGNPALAPTFVQTRLHPTLGEGRDHWWSANPEVVRGQVALEIVSALQIHADKFWERYSDLDAVLREFDQGALVPTGTPRRLVHAALLVRAGRQSDAKSVVAEAARRFPKGSSTFARVSERLRLGS